MGKHWASALKKKEVFFLKNELCQASETLKAGEPARSAASAVALPLLKGDRVAATRERSGVQGKKSRRDIGLELGRTRRHWALTERKTKEGETTPVGA